MSNIISASAMPPQQLEPLPQGSTSIYKAGLIKGQEQTDNQMRMINMSSGGSKRRLKRKQIKGGANLPVVQVPPVSSGAVNQSQTSSNYKDITALAQKQSTDAVYDTAKTPAETANILATQQNIYKTGGSKKNKSKKSKRTRRTRKTRKNKKNSKKHRH
jgi:hypothetical protein